MLFYAQLKREFGPAIWKKGQTLFREDAVKDVRLDGSQVSALVACGSEIENACEVSITMVRGTIGNAVCKCDAGALPRVRCEHVAALSIWIVERGSLLRARVSTASLGTSSEEPEEATSRQAEGVAFVRGIFQDSVLVAVTVEPAIRYYEPDTGERPVFTLNRLVRGANSAPGKPLRDSSLSFRATSCRS